MFLEWNGVEMWIFDIKDFIELYFLWVSQHYRGQKVLTFGPEMREINFYLFSYFPRCCGNNPIVNSGIVDICHDRFI